MAEDVEGFIHEHSLVKPTLIGHSMGAKTAMTLALRRPKLISSLISVDNAPIDAALQSDFAKYTHGMLEVESSKVQRQSDADDILSRYEKSIPFRQFLLTNLYRAPGPDPSSPQSPYLTFRIPIQILAKSLDRMADFPFKNPDEARFEGPTLFVRGTKSQYVADEALPIIGRFFPRFRLVDIESGHWVISEKPEAFRQAVVEFLREND